MSNFDTDVKNLFIIKKAEAKMAPAFSCWNWKEFYLLNLFLTPARPMIPDPIRSMVVGSGTGAGIGPVICVK
jgi:hypothetical protein